MRAYTRRLSRGGMMREALPFAGIRQHARFNTIVVPHECDSTNPIQPRSVWADYDVAAAAPASHNSAENGYTCPATLRSGSLFDLAMPISLVTSDLAVKLPRKRRLLRKDSHVRPQARSCESDRIWRAAQDIDRPAQKTCVSSAATPLRRARGRLSGNKSLAFCTE